MSPRSKQFLRDGWLVGYTAAEIISFLNRAPGPRLGREHEIQIEEYMQTLDLRLEHAVPSQSH